MFTLVLTVLTGLPATTPGGQKEQPPLKKELFAGEDWYKSQKGDEQTFVGVLQRLDRGKGVVGFGRFNPYRLVMEEKGKKDVREVYVGGKLDVLAPYVGKRVKLTGKAVNMEVEGRDHREIWTARLEVVKAADPSESPARPAPGIDEKPNRFESPARRAPEGDQKPAAGKPLKIFAKGYWQHGAASPDSRDKGEQVIIRTADELITRPPWNKLDANNEVLKKQATEAVAKALKVDGIDWGKQMLVVTTAGVKRTGGWKVDIQSVEAGDKTLTVRWTVTPPSGFATQALTHPGQVALVERAEGTPKFEMMPAKGPRIKLPGRPLREFELPPAPKAPPIYECGEKAPGELKVFPQIDPPSARSGLDQGAE